MIDDSDDGDSDYEPSVKSQKVDQSFSCVICLAQGMPEDRLMTAATRVRTCSACIDITSCQSLAGLKRTGRESGKAGPTRLLRV